MIFFINPASRAPRPLFLLGACGAPRPPRRKVPFGPDRARSPAVPGGGVRFIFGVIEAGGPTASPAPPGARGGWAVGGGGIGPSFIAAQKGAGKHPMVATGPVSASRHRGDLGGDRPSRSWAGFLRHGLRLQPVTFRTSGALSSFATGLGLPADGRLLSGFVSVAPLPGWPRNSGAAGCPSAGGMLLMTVGLGGASLPCPPPPPSGLLAVLMIPVGIKRPAGHRPDHRIAARERSRTPLRGGPAGRVQQPAAQLGGRPGPWPSSAPCSPTTPSCFPVCAKSLGDPPRWAALRHRGGEPVAENQRRGPAELVRDGRPGPTYGGAWAAHKATQSQP